MAQPSSPNPGGLTIVNGNTTSNPVNSSNIQAPHTGDESTRNFNHMSRPSVTISAVDAPPFVSNSNSIASPQPHPNVKFGSVDAHLSPAMSHAPLPGDAPRVPTPSESPTPIPQPTVTSGGRPPSARLESDLSFGSLSADHDNRRMPGPHPHQRRESNFPPHQEGWNKKPRMRNGPRDIPGQRNHFSQFPTQTPAPMYPGPHANPQFPVYPPTPADFSGFQDGSFMPNVAPQPFPYDPASYYGSPPGYGQPPGFIQMPFNASPHPQSHGFPPNIPRGSPVHPPAHPPQHSQPHSQPPSFTPNVPHGPKPQPFNKPTSKGVTIRNPNSGAVVDFKQSPPVHNAVLASTEPADSSATESVPGTPASSKTTVAPSQAASSIQGSPQRTDRKTEEERIAEFKDKVKEKVTLAAQHDKEREEREKEETERKKREEQEAKQKEEEAKKAAEEAEKQRLELEKQEQERKEAEKKRKAEEEAEAKRQAEESEKKKAEEAAAAAAASAAAAEEAKKAESQPAPQNTQSVGDDLGLSEEELRRLEQEDEEEAAREEAREKAYKARKQKRQEEEELQRQAELEEFLTQDKNFQREPEQPAQADSTQPPAPASAAAEPSGLNISGRGWKPQSLSVRTGAPPPSEQPPADVSKPQPPKVSASPTRTETPKPAEAPQISPALDALQKARIVSDPTKVPYPDNVASPSPGVPMNVSEKKYRYDATFLLQFQKVMTEKPSSNWNQRLRQVFGDPESARTMSSRGPGRQGSRGAGGYPPNSPMGALGARGAFTPFSGPMGHPLSRTNSSSNLLHSMPGSPRVGSRRGGRADSKRGKQQQQQQQHQREEEAKPPVDVKPLATTGGGWKPKIGASAQSALSADGHMPPDMVQRKVKVALNKITPDNFDIVATQIIDIAQQSKHESDGRTLRQVIQLTFEKATDEAQWSNLYAKFCQRLSQELSPEIRDPNVLDKEGNIASSYVLFRKYLLNRCQEEFQRGWTVNLPKAPEGQNQDPDMMSDEYYIAAAAKRRGLGLMRFIGELFKLGMLTDRIMHACVKKLVDHEGVPEEAEVESLCNLLRTIGSALDRDSKGHEMMSIYFERIDKFINMPDIPSRLKFMLMDIVDLRKQGWRTKQDEAGPKTIAEHKEAATRAAQNDMSRSYHSGSRHGGRPPMGHGDVRSYSHGPNAPFHDHNKLASGELQRLRNFNSSQTTTTFGGPGTTLGSRAGSRRNLGPGGNLVKGAPGFDGMGSRSNSSSHGKKEEKEQPSASTNAFSALGSLND